MKWGGTNAERLEQQVKHWERENIERERTLEVMPAASESCSTTFREAQPKVTNSTVWTWQAHHQRAGTGKQSSYSHHTHSCTERVPPPLLQAPTLKPYRQQKQSVARSLLSKRLKQRALTPLAGSRPASAASIALGVSILSAEPSSTFQLAVLESIY